MTWEKDISRFYVKNKEGTKILKFLNVVTVKQNGSFFEYKITLEGFPEVPLRIAKGVLISFEGIKSIQNKSLLLKGNNEIINLNLCLKDKNLCCDIYISGKPYFNMNYKNRAENQETFSFVNEDANVGLQLHFYEVPNKEFCLMICDPSILAWIKQKYYYIKYVLLKVWKKHLKLIYLVYSQLIDVTCHKRLP